MIVAYKNNNENKILVIDKENTNRIIKGDGFVIASLMSEECNNAIALVSKRIAKPKLSKSFLIYDLIPKLYDELSNNNLIEIDKGLRSMEWDFLILNNEAIYLVKANFDIYLIEDFIAIGEEGEKLTMAYLMGYNNNLNIEDSIKENISKLNPSLKRLKLYNSLGELKEEGSL